MHVHVFGEDTHTHTHTNMQTAKQAYDHKNKKRLHHQLQLLHTHIINACSRQFFRIFFFLWPVYNLFVIDVCSSGKFVSLPG